MQVFRSISWIADSMPYAPSEKDAKWTRRSDRTLWLSEAFRERYPVSKPSVYRGTGDVKFSHRDIHILATHPRPYKQWAYDCLKVDIVVTSEKYELKMAMEKLAEEKRDALKLKSNLEEKLNAIKPMLSLLLRRGMIDGVVGRGSYFDRNGYPAQRDDIDIILLKRGRVGTKEEWEAFNKKIIKAISSSKGNFGANFVHFNEREIKKARGSKGPEFSFTMLTEDIRGAGINYERYVLESARGVAIRGLAASVSESVARALELKLPIDDRKKLIDEGRLTVFPRPPK